jgi:hypothetical protein
MDAVDDGISNSPEFEKVFLEPQKLITFSFRDFTVWRLCLDILRARDAG